jgi:16S rRNA G1207 methylase RsmC
MSGISVRRWRVNMDADRAESGIGTVVLTADQLPAARSAGAPVFGLHEAMSATDLMPASEVDIEFPDYRSKSTIPLLAWLVAVRLARPDAVVTWWMSKRQGPDSVLRLLSGLGWRLERDKIGGRIALTGSAPAPLAVEPLPAPAHFTTSLGAAEITFAADYGVFSPREVDEGTRLLFDVVLRRNQTVASLADIGVGYGALAIGLVRCGLAAAAVATDVDCLALLLARRNAAAADVPLALACTPNPLDVAPTELTVCNVPTHIDAAATADLMRGLAQRARDGQLQIVVHASLEERYRRHLADHRLRVERDPGARHVVLTARG